MHQTFYIDIDEEITSAIDRLRKSKTKENIFVVPKRALILQSVVNLRLLKKEAGKLKKQIMIISQDEQGRALAEKVGIFSQQSLEGVEVKEELKIKVHPQINSERQKNLNKKVKKKRKLENVGSKDFYEKDKKTMDAKNSLEAEKKVVVGKKKIEEKKILVKKQGRDHVVSGVVKSVDFPSSSLKYHPSNVKKVKSGSGGDYAKYKKDIDPRKEEELKELFQLDKHQDQPKKQLQVSVPKKTKKIFILFGIVSVAVILLVGIFLIFPRAKISIHMSSNVQTIDLEIKGNSNAVISDLEGRSVPARAIEKDAERTESFSATGRNEISDQKTRGTIAIYNEHGTSPQPLVATTRFLTPDGKLFRLVKGVTVPGMTEVDGKLKPGVIEAEVIADQPGEEYNIGPSDFSIPGLKGSSKYEKFYARSASSMSGGGSKGDEVVIISQKDIDNARSKVEASLMEEIKNEIRNNLQGDEVFIEETAEKIILESDSPEIGITTDSFEFKLKIRVRAIVFSEEKLKDVVMDSFDKKSDEKLNSLKIEYGEATPDFDTGIINIKVHGKALFDPLIDTDKLKAELLGNNEEQIKEILNNYSRI
ncbi:MAG TPA: hypothetical protein ENH35_02265, partial [Candidatus Moranbacteria bacterium]|nr:hypothetical protein [Candidatus Moranbacteria bacterium]